MSGNEKMKKKRKMRKWEFEKWETAKMRNEKKISKYGISKEEMSKGRPRSIHCSALSRKWQNLTMRKEKGNNEKRKMIKRETWN